MDSVTLDQAKSPRILLVFAIGCAVLYPLWRAIYNVYFHPLRHVPGPKLCAATRIPQIRHLLAGTRVHNITALHRKYGPVVRFSPNEVSFTSGDTAWPEIYGFRTGKMRGHANMQKDPAWYASPRNGAPSIIFAGDESHGRMRRVLAHAFSTQALHEQEGLIQQYVDQLVSRLDEVTSASGAAQDMTAWFNWTTFDVIADLLYGQPFGCLQNLETHKYVRLVFQGVNAAPLKYIMDYWPWAKYLGSLIINKKKLTGREEYLDWIDKEALRRYEMETERPDFMTYIKRHNVGKDGQTMSFEEVVSNTSLIIIAGSETTATMLSGTLYLLLQNPSILDRLQKHLRQQFAHYSDITLDALKDDEFLLAIIQEGLRLFPPVPTGFSRKVSAGGEMVSGYFMPESTCVSVSSFPAGRSEDNFRDCERFIPERWMGDERFADDKRQGFQPFSFGPRACLGKNLAYAEMKLIIAKMYWTFDVKLDPSSERWFEGCRTNTLWIKPPLMVHITKHEHQK